MNALHIKIRKGSRTEHKKKDAIFATSVKKGWTVSSRCMLTPNGQKMQWMARRKLIAAVLMWLIGRMTCFLWNPARGVTRFMACGGGAERGDLCPAMLTCRAARFFGPSGVWSCSLCGAADWTLEPQTHFFVLMESDFLIEKRSSSHDDLSLRLFVVFATKWVRWNFTQMQTWWMRMQMFSSRFMLTCTGIAAVTADLCSSGAGTGYCRAPAGLTPTPHPAETGSPETIMTWYEYQLHGIWYQPKTHVD